jgi:hypothetical protein
MSLIAIKAFISCLLRNAHSILIAIGIGLLVYTGFSMGYSLAAKRAAHEVHAVEKRLEGYKAAQEKRQQELQQRYDTVSQEYEAARAKREVVTRTITKEIVREIQKPVYRECVVPADGVRLLNAARSEPIDPSEFAPALPADSPTRRGSDYGQIGGG